MSQNEKDEKSKSLGLAGFLGAAVALITLLTAFVNNKGVDLLQDLIKTKASPSPSPSLVTPATPTSTSSSTSTPTPLSKPSSAPVVQISLPLPGSSVPRTSSITGSVENLSSDLDMWLYVKGSGEAKYYLQQIINKPTSGNGQWRIDNVVIGSEGTADNGADYEIGTVLIPI